MATRNYNTLTPEVTVFTLPNGLRCVHSRALGEVSYVGLVVNAGSRDESPAHDGLAHFVEHTLFKGTTRRRSWSISNRMESVGGELNAYTSKEETLVYINAPHGYLDRSLSLLAELVTDSCFPADELENEREVVVEEIKSYLDSPADNVFDAFDENMYAGSRLAHNILGTPESVRALSGHDCRRWLDTCYTPDNMVLYIVDDGPASRAERIASRRFGAMHLACSRPQRIVPPVNEPFTRRIDNGGHQSHTIIGARTMGRTDPRRFALFLMNNYLGGPSMNSRLNIELRDKRGLVYTVDSSLALMSDCGLLQIYYGTDHDSVDRCRRMIVKELTRLAETPLTPARLEKAKRQYLGQLSMASDQRESMAMSLGKSLLYYGQIRGRRFTAEQIAAVTAEQVRAVAEDLLNAGLCTLTIS